MKRLALTTGDPDGIGFEVADKALARVGPRPGYQYVLWRSSTCRQKFSAPTRRKFKILQVKSLGEALLAKASPSLLIEIASSLPPAEWVRLSALAALDGDLQGLCTGPLSKTSPGADGGHTGIFRKLVSAPLYMLFLGSKFRVLLLTDHIPLKSVPENLKKTDLTQTLMLAQDFIKRFFPGVRRRPIGVLGLNPHAGEHGILGPEETDFLLPRLKNVPPKVKWAGPLVPDAAFLPAEWKKFSLYLALYHDQGLIPFKMIHGHEGGVHVTLGLPFVRTSVDHGTAKDLFGKNRADAGSMVDALKWAMKLTAKA
jgi:4-hydroxythreonine-4-phosphate dehydrogenase